MGLCTIVMSVCGTRGFTFYVDNNFEVSIDLAGGGLNNYGHSLPTMLGASLPASYLQFKVLAVTFKAPHCYGLYSISSLWPAFVEPTCPIIL